MKRLKLVLIPSLATLIMFTATLASSPLSAQQHGPTLNRPNPDAEALWRRLQQVDESLREVRRDQLNYKVEKDLLKEAYASNLQTVNIVIALVLGTLTVILTVLGFLGIRSIAAIRQEFRHELERLAGLRTQFEDKFRNFDSRLTEAKTKFDEIAGVTKSQEQRLRVLEIQEKVGSLLSQKNYRRALEYIEVGLGLVPDDVTLLRQQVGTFMGLNRLAEALRPAERILDLEPNDPSTICNTIELYLLNLRIPDAEALLLRYRELLTTFAGPYLSWYFTALKYYLEGNEEKLRGHLVTHPVESPPQKEPRIKTSWSFSEARGVIVPRPDSLLKELILKVLEFLEGNLSLDDLQKLINPGSHNP